MANIDDSMRRSIGIYPANYNQGHEFNDATFNGNGFRITVAIDSTSSMNVNNRALFATVRGAVTIENLTITDYIKSRCASGIVGLILVKDYAPVIIKNCINAANITSQFHAGGIASRMA